MEQHGFDLGEARPAALDLTHQELVEKHVIVSLQGPVNDYFEKIPFHTTDVEWEVGSVAGSDDDAQTSQRLETLYREIAMQVRDLMETLRGTDAP